MTIFKSKKTPSSKQRWKSGAKLKKIKNCRMKCKKNERRMKSSSTLECAKKIASVVFKR